MAGSWSGEFGMPRGGCSIFCSSDARSAVGSLGPRSCLCAFVRRRRCVPPRVWQRGHRPTLCAFVALKPAMAFDVMVSLDTALSCVRDPEMSRVGRDRIDITCRIRFRTKEESNVKTSPVLNTKHMCLRCDVISCVCYTSVHSWKWH